MRFTQSQIERIARDFWAGTDRMQFPYDVRHAANIIELQIDIAFLPELSLSAINGWLEARNIINTFKTVNVSNRDLQGFVLNHNGSATVFINASDTEMDQRFTLAHEISHFLLDHKLPRDKAFVQLGDPIMDVLDGKRKATVKELLESALDGVNIDCHDHLIEQEGDGSFRRWTNFQAEKDADRLAIELLAPRKLVIMDAMQRDGHLSYPVLLERYCDILLNKYQLPFEIARQYASELTYAITSGPSILDNLGL